MSDILKLTKNKIKNEKYVLTAFGMCLLITLIGYAYMGIYPFGSNSVLKIDMYHQYAPFHEELRHKILNGSSLLYSWGGLGKNFIAQFAYYTSSPLNLLLLFTNQTNIPSVMGYLILIKIGFCGAFFAHYLKKRFAKDGTAIVIFAVFYGLSAYITAFYWNIMWLDVIALFPVVALGIHRIIANGKYRTYLFSLAACILMNFYLAFLVCIFSVIYFIIFLLCKYRVKDIKNYIKPALIFFISSLLAGGISMALILPTYNALTDTAAYSTAFPESVKLYFNVLDYVSAHFWGITPKVMVTNESLPNIYCGVLTIILLPFYYMNKKTAFKEKILMSAFLAVLFLGFFINVIDFIFHGFHFPACLPHRFSFIYIFLIISMAYKAFIDIDHININHCAIFSIMLALYIFINEKFIVFPDSDMILDNSALIINFIFLTVYAVLLVLLKTKPAKKNYVNASLLIIAAVEFSMSAVLTFPYKGYTEIDGYTRHMNDITETVSYLDSIDDSFYRMEFFRMQTTNDSSLFHYRGMTQFSSTANGNTTKLFERMGVSATANSCRYYDPTQLISAMVSMKYIVFRDNVAYENVNEKIDLNLVETIGGLSVYENPYCLPLGYTVNKEILDLQAAQDNPFTVQNEFIKKATDMDAKMFTPFSETKVTMKFADVTENTKDGVYSYKLQDEKNLALVPEFKAVFKNPVEQHVYLYVESANSTGVTVQVGNAVSNRDFSAGRGTIDIGFVKADTDIIVSFTLDRRGDDEKQYRVTGTIRAFAAGYNSEVFKDAYSMMDAQTLDVHEFTDTFLKGTITIENEGVLLTSIPYDKGWNIYLNGNKTDSIDFQNNAFLALHLTEGTYDIEMKFVPYGFILGIIITIMSICIIVLYEILSKFFNRRNRYIDK